MLVEKIEEKQIKSALKFRIFKVHLTPNQLEAFAGKEPKQKEFMYFFSLEDNDFIYLDKVKKKVKPNSKLHNELEEFRLSSQ